MASTDIDVAFVSRFQDDFRELYQQKTSKLRDSVDTDFTQDGAEIYFDFIGLAKVRRRQTVAEPTQHNPPPFSRRVIRPATYKWDAYLSPVDIQKIGRTPQNKWLTAAASAHERNTDLVIIAAAFGAAIAVDEARAETTVALPATQQIPVAATGLTFPKVLATKTLMDKAEVPDTDRYAVIDPAQEANLLTIAQSTSSDYVGGRPILVDGKIDRWLGFQWRTSNLLPTDGSGNRLDLFYHKSAIGLWVPMDQKTDVAPDPGRSFDVAMVLQMSLSATRIYEAGVVQVACQES